MYVCAWRCIACAMRVWGTWLALHTAAIAGVAVSNSWPRLRCKRIRGVQFDIFLQVDVTFARLNQQIRQKHVVIDAG